MTGSGHVGRRPRGRNTPARAVHSLFDARRWRTAGAREYRFSTEALDWLGWPLNLLRWALCVMCLSIAALGAVMQFHPYGPKGPVLRTLHAVVLVSSLVVGALWVTRPWPDHRWAIAFVIWADLGVAIDAAVLSRPEARLCATIHMSMIGVYVGFLLGWRILSLHCAFCVVLIAGFTVWAVARDHESLLILYIYIAPALTTVVAVPVVIQAVVEGGRAAAYRIAGDSQRDPLTGLLNRRGLHRYAATMAARRTHRDWIAVAVVDLDGFKVLNDERGHAFGDTLLTAAAQRLSEAAADGVVARTGGDEFVVVATVNGVHAAQRLAERCVLRLFRSDDPLVTSSVGLAAAPCGAVSFDALQHDADVAMYRAKRAGGSRSVVSLFGDMDGAPA